jgi:hypothetical protein
LDYSKELRYDLGLRLILPASISRRPLFDCNAPIKPILVAMHFKINGGGDATYDSTGRGNDIKSLTKGLA